MLVAVMCFDKPGNMDLRKETRPAHLAWLGDADIGLVHGGPILADDGETPMGSLIIAEFETLAAARAFFAEDPYTKAGVFEHVMIQPIRKVLPAA